MSNGRLNLQSTSDASSASQTESEDTDYLEEIIDAPHQSPRTKEMAKILLRDREQSKISVCMLIPFDRLI